MKRIVGTEMTAASTTCTARRTTPQRSTQHLAVHDNPHTVIEHDAMPQQHVPQKRCPLSHQELDVAGNVVPGPKVLQVKVSELVAAGGATTLSSRSIPLSHLTPQHAPTYNHAHPHMHNSSSTSGHYTPNGSARAAQRQSNRRQHTHPNTQPDHACLAKHDC